MDIKTSLKQLKAFARIEGLYLGLMWLVSFFFVVYLPQSLWGNLMILSTPFFVAWRAKWFRNKVLNGFISFKRAFVYLMYMFFYGSLIFATGQFIYFKFFDHGNFLSFLTSTINQLIPIYKESGVNENELKESLNLLSTMSHGEMVMMFFSQNIMIGIVLSAVVALVVARKNTNDQHINL